ncbi:hypothetical protein ACWGJ2_38770 [Streptomyces sp. NPDC054796]
MMIKLTVIAATVLPLAVLASGTAHADEKHTDSHNGPHIALISTGQIDDPMEDVLEHAAVFGETYVFD